MNYKIEFSNRAYRYYEKLDKILKQRISNHLQLLSDNPRNPELDIKKIKGYSSLYRLRIGNYRIVYAIEDEVLVIVIVKIGPRGDIYNDI